MTGLVRAPESSLSRLSDEGSVLLSNGLLEVAIEHVDGDAVLAQVPDAVAVDRWVRVFDADPHLSDAGLHDPLGAAELWMSTRAWSAWLERRKQHRAVQWSIMVLALEDGVLGMIAAAHLAAASRVHAAVRASDYRADQRTSLAVGARFADRLSHDLDCLDHEVARLFSWQVRSHGVAFSPRPLHVAPILNDGSCGCHGAQR